MKNDIQKVALLTFGLGFLAACGGGDGVTSVTSDAIVGVNAHTGANPQLVTLVTTSGALNGTQGLSLDVDGYTYAASQGFANGIAVEDGSSIGVLSEISLPTATDMRLFDGAYDDGSGVVGVYYGIAGAALTDAMPTSNSATWTGSGFANLVTGTGTTNLGVGTASVTANFAGGVTTANLSGFSGPLDAVALGNMAISNGRFSGSSVQTLMSGSAVNVVGPNAVGDAQGVFSGAQTTTGSPDEVGGLFTLTGDSATLIGGFLAD